ncbi:MAG: type II toxin-antitoxin system prevent-host-death family antitoxin [Candidatus Sumerlaeota bacterium]|nr:type II toxin-antitoxin system prevent-host-death family antitoxin [Candidatus Sumerlaeota bacterium]
MRFVTVRDFRARSAQVWSELAHEKEMVITSNGRPIAVLTAVDERNVEESLQAWRRARATQAIAQIQRDSLRKGTDRITKGEIEAEIRKARAARRRRRA